MAFSRFVLRRAGFIAWIGTLLAVVGAYYSVQLYKNLRTDIEELLPTTARSVQDLSEVTQRLESIDSLAVLVFSADTQASRRFVDDLAARLQKAPKDVISSVEYKISDELAFFEKRRPLYMDLEDLQRVRNYIQDRIAYEKALYNPLNIFSEQEIPEPILDFGALENKYALRASGFLRYPDGYYATQDETKRALLVYRPGQRDAFGGSRKLKSYVVDTIDSLNPGSYAKDLEIRYSGGVQNMIEEQTALVEDLELSTIIVLVLTSIAMYAFFRTLRATAALLASLLMGTFWTFGVSFFLVGYLNANSAFLGAIVIGNGINFGIILLARYLEERRLGRDNDRALTIAMRHTAAATSTAALAAGLSYGSLMLTSFRGFAQFGVIGLVGMVLCWISAFTLLPAFLTIMDRRRPIDFERRTRPKPIFANALAAMINKAPGLIWAGAFVATVISLAMLVGFEPDKLIETDLRKLRSKESIEKGSVYYSKYMDEIFQRYLSPVVALPRSREDAKEIAELLKRAKAEQGELSTIHRVQTIDDFVPENQQKKIRLIQDIRSQLTPRILRELNAKEKRLLDEYLTPESLKPVTMQDLPALVRNKFREKSGDIGRLVVVEPPVGAKSLADKDKLLNFVGTIRNVADLVEPGTPVAGSQPISADIFSSISRDGPRATLFAFGAVVLLVIFIFRNPRIIGLALFSLMLGVVWLGGIILGFDIKINFLNFIALPITFGIGIDYGVNILQRYREEGGTHILAVIRDTGGAVALCSLTTIIGYGSLLIAQNQAFVSFGLLAVLGELTCAVAAIGALPAYLLLPERRLSRRQRRQQRG